MDRVEKGKQERGESKVEEEIVGVKRRKERKGRKEEHKCIGWKQEEGMGGKNNNPSTSAVAILAAFRP